MAIFTLGTNLLAYNAIGRPCYALYTIKKDAELARAHKDCLLEEHVIKFKERVLEAAKDSPLR